MKAEKKLITLLEAEVISLISGFGKAEGELLSLKIIIA